MAVLQMPNLTAFVAFNDAILCPIMQSVAIHSTKNYRFLFLSTHADRQGVDISFTAGVFLCLFVCVCLYGYGFLRRG